MIVSKYCASGNDFLIFHTLESKDRSTMAVNLCNRFYGIGADGLVILLPYTQTLSNSQDKIAYKWEFYNSDGSMANMCGNASRAVSLYAYHNNLAPLRHSFLSKVGVIQTQIQEIINPKEAFVQSNLGSYKFERSVVEHHKENIYNFELIIMGIPHLVCHTDSMYDFNLLSVDLEFLAKLRNKYNANVNIAFRNNQTIHYATFERGVEGITQACGTGACAVYVSYKDFQREYTLIPPSKERLVVSCKEKQIHFAGIVHKVCDCML
ncbi:diaminopimelate epimerase [Helicobacter didelphidarum]|uniref:Diaminopimelate epimerase n=1 Tax=Helicobacter didelphidarum TaxID=2040648 RepID=A0A3D8IPA9_9HELI|nr:diaminopimelate epimerase [Helicobacter didelphidarum]RDU67079.1 diaminopimelate epimerase [Helicobacter didelphidarum]